MGTPKEGLRIVGALPALVLVVASLGELWSATHYGSSVPEARDWERAHELLAQRHRPGELIVFAPAWLDPVGRQHLGEWMNAEMVGRMDSASFQVLWELSTNGESAREVRGLHATGEWSFGELRVRRFEQEPAVTVYDFGRQLASARVSGKMAGRPRRVLEEVGFEPHHCVRVEPTSKDKVVLQYPDVTLGSSLVGYVGLADVFTRRDIRSPASFAVRIGGQEVVDLEVGIDDGWVRFAAPTSSADSVQVEFVIAARDLRRLVCFAAEARK